MSNKKCNFVLEMSDTRTQIVAKARQLYEQYGIKSVSMDDICHELGISKKTLYVVFEQKEDLVTAVLDHIQYEFEQKLEALFMGNESIWLVISEMVERTRQVPDIRRMPPFFYDLNKYYPQIARSHSLRVRAKNIEGLERVLLTGVREGIFRVDLDIPMVAQWLAKMQGGAIEESLRDAENHDCRSLFAAASDVVLRGLMTPEAVAKYEKLKS